MTAYQGSGGNEPPRGSQKSLVLDYLRAGGSLSQLEATKKFGCTRLASIVYSLKQEGWEIDKEMHTARNGNQYAVYRLDDAKPQPDEPGLFESLADDGNQGQPQPYDTVDESTTALKPGNPVEVYGTEIRAHHVSNPDDTKQILQTFRDYCAKTHNQRVEITSDWSRQLLKLNRDLPHESPAELKRNRKIAKKKLEKFKRHMVAGTFQYTSQGLGFDEDGWLIDGQTRLTASVETGKTFYANVTFDLSPEVFAILDSQESSRKKSDFAHMCGIEHYGKEHIAAASIIYRKDNGKGHTEALDEMEAVAAIRNYPDLDECVAHAMSMKWKLIPGPRAVIAAVHYLARRVNKAVADKAFEDLKTGAIAKTTDPVLVARNRLIMAYSDSPNEFTGGGDKKVRVLLSRMFNYRLVGKETTAFKLPGGDDWPVGSVRVDKDASDKTS